MKKKILFVNPHQFGHTAGYYYYCTYLKLEFDITFVCFDSGLEKLINEGINVIYIPKSRNKTSGLAHFLLSAIKLSWCQHFDVIYVYSFYFSFVVGLFSRAGHKFIDIRTASISTNPQKRIFQNRFIRFNSIFFDKYIVLTNDLIDILKLRRTKTHYLPLGSEVYFKSSHDFKTISLLYVGALNTRNIVQTIEGLNLFIQQGSYLRELSYTIIGFGKKDEESKIKQAITAYQLENFVYFAGRKNCLELKPYFESCNIGVSWIPITPAFNHQPATKTYEYILSGLFCIATATKANQEVINGDNGILCHDSPEAFAEALKKIYSLRKAFDSNTIRKTLEQFSWENLVHNNLAPFLRDL